MEVRSNNEKKQLESRLRRAEEAAGREKEEGARLRWVQRVFVWGDVCMCVCCMFIHISCYCQRPWSDGYPVFSLTYTTHTRTRLCRAELERAGAETDYLTSALKAARAEAQRLVVQQQEREEAEAAAGVVRKAQPGLGQGDEEVEGLRAALAAAEERATGLEASVEALGRERHALAVDKKVCVGKGKE